MPPGNITEITRSRRALLAAWAGNDRSHLELLSFSPMSATPIRELGLPCFAMQRLGRRGPGPSTRLPSATIPWPWRLSPARHRWPSAVLRSPPLIYLPPSKLRWASSTATPSSCYRRRARNRPVVLAASPIAPQGDPSLLFCCYPGDCDAGPSSICARAAGIHAATKPSRGRHGHAPTVRSSNI